jgi:S-formylglutathione hydrolase FrmB
MNREQILEYLREEYSRWRDWERDDADQLASGICMGATAALANAIAHISIHKEPTGRI